MSAHGTCERIEGRTALRFTRRLRHPAERVWEAVTAAAKGCELVPVPR